MNPNLAKIKEDFEKRREDRRRLEDGWLLNMRFLSGDQYCDVAPQGGLMEEEKNILFELRNCIVDYDDTKIKLFKKFSEEYLNEALDGMKKG